MTLPTLPALLALLAAAPLPAAQEGPRTLTPDQMQADLFELTDAFESLHAGLRRYATAEELDGAYGEAFAAVQEERTVLGFYRTVSALVAAVHCGHTRVGMADRDVLAVCERKGLLPLEVHLTGERAWVLRVLDDAVPLEPGTELRAVDGLTIAEIRRAAFARMSGDGFIETGRERLLEADFARLFALLVDDHAGFPDRFVVEVEGGTQALELAGLPLAEHQARRTPRPERPLVELEIDAEADLGLLAVSAFGDRSGEPSMPEQLEAAFRELREERVSNLVLDLRGNGGGVDNYGATLVSYLADRPFGYFDRIEVTPDYRGDFEIVERDGMRLMMSHRGLGTWQPAEWRFLGDVWVLTDGWTFSTAADVATVAHHNGFATFVGEETGGGYDGNTSGDSDSLTLAFSGFGVRLPKWMYTTANVGHAFHGRGVIPDHAVRPTVEDVLAGRDPALDRARELIRAKGRGR